MRQLVDGVFEIEIGFVHAHLVVTDSGVVLVDTGLPGRSVALARALVDVGRRVGEVSAILLTHRHADHTGGAAELRRRSGARTVAHAADAGSIQGSGTVASTPLQRLLAAVLPTAEPVRVDEVLHGDGPLSVPGFSAVHTPGHTPGHVSFVLDRDGGVLFAGDAAAGRRAGVGRSPRLMTADGQAAENSLRRLAELEFEIAVFGHGRAVTERAVDDFRRLVRF